MQDMCEILLEKITIHISFFIFTSYTHTRARAYIHTQNVFCIRRASVLECKFSVYVLLARQIAIEAYILRRSSRNSR